MEAKTTQISEKKEEKIESKIMKNKENKREEIDKTEVKPKDNIKNSDQNNQVQDNKEKQKEDSKDEKTELESNKKEVKKEIQKEKPKKTEAIAHGSGIPASKKHSMYICSFIKNKKIDDAIFYLEEVTKLKRAIPFKGEIPHRKGMMSGRYPVNASEIFISLLKGLRGNVLVNGMDLEKTRIVTASASWASRPMKREGRRAKRTNVILIAKEVSK